MRRRNFLLDPLDCRRGALDDAIMRRDVQAEPLGSGRDSVSAGAGDGEDRAGLVSRAPPCLRGAFRVDRAAETAISLLDNSADSEASAVATNSGR
jgi:hypothetical protein